MEYYRSPVQIPVVPSTPAPKSIEDIQINARERFAGIIWIQKEQFRSIDDYFIDYDHWEVYSEIKSYSKRSYQAAYKGMMREYHNYLCILNTEQTDEYYVVAKRVKNELEILEPYCICEKCISSKLNPMKYIWCNYCTRCIKAGPGFAKEEYIIKAKELIEENKKRKNIQTKYGKYLNYFKEIKPIRMVELSVVGLIIFAVLLVYIS